MVEATTYSQPEETKGQRQPEEAKGETDKRKDPYAIDESAVGISLGNTFSGVARVSERIIDGIEDVKCNMVPDEDGDLVYPSCVFYPKDSDSPWVGAKAKRRSIYYPGRVFHDSQIMLGKLMNDPVIQ